METQRFDTAEKTLLDVPEGREVTVKRIVSGKGLRCRLEGMGIYPGQRIKVLRNGPGPLLIEVFGRKIGIGRGQAAKILVEESDRAG